MPIKPENRAKYPTDWPQIRERILARAGNRCERCLAPNHLVILRSGDGATYMLPEGEIHDATTGDLLGVGRGSEYPAGGFVRIVLTIAHVADQDPANCADDNLQALCQRCHNRLDAPMRAVHARETRRARRATGDLFP